MPDVRHGALSGFYLPDYERESVLNLLSSIVRSRRGKSPHAELKGLSARSLSGIRRLVYLVVDGLGEEQLGVYLARGKGSRFFGTRPHQTISTVFPATTAAAITTFTTGTSPAEHGVLGWHLHLGDLGLVSTVLLSTTRLGAPLATTEFSLRDYLRIPSRIDSLPCETHLLSFGNIPRSRYSLAGTRWDERASFSTLRGLERQVAAFIRSGPSALAHCYWPGYDTLCHEHGCEHRTTLRHLGAIDETLARLAAATEEAGAALLVTADHGLVDTAQGSTIELRDVAGLYGCLSVLPSGDARGVHCFVRPGKVKRFLRIVRSDIAKACVCLPGEELIATGAFGPGREHPAFRARVGDHVLLARDAFALAATPTGFETHAKAANHGGMSAREVRVPLFTVGV